MKRNSLFTKIAALMLCVMMVIGCLPVSAFAANYVEGEMDVMETKATLLIGDNELKVYTGMATTIYTYNATAEGTLSITMPNYIGWSYELKNGADVKKSSTADAEVIANPSIDVKNGDVVTLTVTTNGPTKPVATTIYAAFSYKEGSDANPIKVNTPRGGSYTIAAGETLYFAVYSSMGQWSGNMTISSEAPFTAFVNGRMPAMNGVPVAIEYNARFGREVLFNITNTSEADADYSISFETPIGTMDNPADLNVGTVDAKGENSAASEYVFAYSVEETGTITIEMTSDTWFYSIEKIDGLTLVPTATGETWSDVEGASAIVSYDVVAGDSIKVLVQPYSAAEVTFNAWFEAEAEEPEETDPPVETVPVAKIGETGYATVAEALNAAKANETVTLIDNAVEDKLYIPADVYVNLGTYNLTANMIIGLKGSYVYGNTINSAGNPIGTLTVPRNSISLASSAYFDGTYYWIPAYIDGCYKFVKAKLDLNAETYTPDTDIAFLNYGVSWSGVFRKNYLMNNGGSLYGVNIVCAVGYSTTDTDETIEVVYNDKFIKTASTTSSGFYTYTLEEASAKTDLTMTGMVVTETGVYIALDPYEVN